MQSVDEISVMPVTEIGPVRLSSSFACCTLISRFKKKEKDWTSHDLVTI